MVGKTSKFNEVFLKNYNENSVTGYFLEIYFQCPENLHIRDSDLPFLSKRMNIENLRKLAANLHDEKECYPQKNKIIHKFYRKTWRKSYINMNTELRKKKLKK